LPRPLHLLEADVKERVAAVVARGRVEVSIQAALPDAGTETVVASRPLVTSLVRTLRDMQSEYGLEGGVSVADLVRFPGAIERVEGVAEVPDEVRGVVGDLVSQALDGLDGMRRAEGERLRGELERLLDAIDGGASRIEGRLAQTRGPRQTALLERTRELVGDLGLEDARLYQEVVRAVERHDVVEEIHRLRSHAASARELLAADGAQAGKRLDFLAQELMREANTVGSKVQDAPAIREVVELKAEIERFREQVQNVE
ncbi:MAG TPA: YicC/YloC family endoribonuclease, partial [Vicinamibacteria bacterium]|nr:YicC/YloC family endoribonuclease [Vicinamibacteria bacterium]